MKTILTITTENYYSFYRFTFIVDEPQIISSNRHILSLSRIKHSLKRLSSSIYNNEMDYFIGFQAWKIDNDFQFCLREAASPMNRYVKNDSSNIFPTSNDFSNSNDIFPTSVDHSNFGWNFLTFF